MQEVIFGTRPRIGYRCWEDVGEYGQAVSSGTCLRIPFFEEAY